MCTFSEEGNILIRGPAHRQKCCRCGSTCERSNRNAPLRFCIVEAGPLIVRRVVLDDRMFGRAIGEASWDAAGYDEAGRSQANQ